MLWPYGVPANFFPILSREMMVRPNQIRTDAEDAAFMMPVAATSSARYKELRLPITIIAGADDKDRRS
jgi:hypothetical protein